MHQFSRARGVFLRALLSLGYLRSAFVQFLIIVILFMLRFALGLYVSSLVIVAVLPARRAFHKY
jgi:hypothetical protein